MAEEPVQGGVVGPTFACIIGKQFKNIMEGDRLFFTHKYEGFKGGLPTDLKRIIRKRSFHDIMCDNIPIEELPLNMFNISSQKVKCSERNKLDSPTAVRQLKIMLTGESLRSE